MPFWLDTDRLQDLHSIALHAADDGGLCLNLMQENGVQHAYKMPVGLAYLLRIALNRVVKHRGASEAKVFDKSKLS